LQIFIALFVGAEEACPPAAVLSLPELELEEAASCSPLKTAPHGAWRCSSSTPISGTICYAKCTTGYHLSLGFKTVCRPILAVLKYDILILKRKLGKF